MYYTYDDSLFSDLHKEVYGFRPSSDLYADWNSRTPRQKQELWNALCDEHEAAIKREKEAKEIALESLYDRIYNMIDLGAKDTKDAIRWIIQAEEFSDFDLQYGADYFCYHFDVDYSVKNRLPIQEVINEALAYVD
jgi:hypothetical protein